MKCPHGYEGGGKDYITVSDGSSEDKAVARHRRKCGGRIFWHSAWIFFRTLCCDGCGKNVY